MKNLVLVHNYYQEPGGEDRVFEAEAGLLESRGHKVTRYIVHNDAIKSMSSIATAGRTMWNNHTYRQLRQLIRRENPSIVHFHNTFPLVSPAGYYAAQAEGVAVVQTLHNYRLLCPNALLFRNRQVCESCIDKRFKWPSIVHRCYRHSRLASATSATMNFVHDVAGTWHRKIDQFIALTEFSRSKFILGGLDENEIAVKPNFVADPGTVRSPENRLAKGLYVGRLSEEKGIDLMLDAWADIAVPLQILGDGPLAGKIRKRVHPSINYLGAKDHDSVLNEMKRCSFLVFPSECYENMSLSILEALASGLPVIASRSAANPELIQEGETGLLFNPGDKTDFAAKVQWAYANPDTLKRMGAKARTVYEERYTASTNYDLLTEVYDQAMQRQSAKHNKKI